MIEYLKLYKNIYLTTNPESSWPPILPDDYELAKHSLDTWSSETKIIIIQGVIRGQINNYLTIKKI